MRIIAGRLGGRVFASPTGHRTHPMSDKMRGALFNMLGDVEGTRVLDAFAGSGALGFEAVSRGAAQVVGIELDRRAQQAISANIHALQLTNYKLIKANAAAWLTTSDNQFDIVLLDPPYDNTQLPLLQKLCARAVSGGRIIISWPGKQLPPDLHGVTLLRSKVYGDGSLQLYERATAAAGTSSR